jgi:two-component system response regulator YesN
VRIGNAKRLLIETEKSIADISEEVGFNDIKYFTKKFKKLTFLSPSEYRKLYS